MLDFLKKLFYTESEEVDRIYHFPLPYKIEVIYLHYGLKQLKAEGIFQQLPKELQNKWMKALDNWRDLRVTKADLDQIDEKTWTRIAAKLKLKWENKNEN